jgi:hypothetical protein
MQCPTCIETTVTAFCRNCGKGVCRQCVVDVDGVTYCGECAESAPDAADAPSPAEPGSPRLSPGQPPAPPLPSVAGPAPEGPNPALAGILGVVPGLGAVYNGQYVKGVMHVLIFGSLLAIATNADAMTPLLVPMIVLFWFYMVIEGVRTAQAMRRGETVGEMDGLAGKLFQTSSQSPVAGIVTIAAGVLLLLYTLGLLDMDSVRPFWPLLVIGFGVYRLYRAVQIRAASRDRLEDLGERP